MKVYHFNQRALPSAFNYVGGFSGEMITIPANTYQVNSIATRNSSSLTILASRDGAARATLSSLQFPASTSGFKLFIEVEYPIV